MKFFNTFALDSGIKITTGYLLDTMKSNSVLTLTGAAAYFYSPLIPSNQP